MIRLTFAALLFAAPAFAQQQPSCGPREGVVKSLDEKYGETLHSLGIHQQGDLVLEVYSSDETGTWTILLSRPDGISCMMASGQAWQPDASSLTPEGDPS